MGMDVRDDVHDDGDHYDEVAADSSPDSTSFAFPIFQSEVPVINHAAGAGGYSCVWPEKWNLTIDHI